MITPVSDSGFVCTIFRFKDFLESKKDGDERLAYPSADTGQLVQAFHKEKLATFAHMHLVRIEEDATAKPGLKITGQLGKVRKCKEEVLTWLQALRVEHCVLEVRRFLSSLLKRVIRAPVFNLSLLKDIMSNACPVWAKVSRKSQASFAQ